MPRLRRFASLLILPLAFQQALAANGVVCIRPAPVAGAATDMAEMNMPATSDKSGDSHRPTRGPCDKPFAPSNRQPLAVCGGTVVLPVMASIDAGRGIAPARVASLTVLPPASRTTAPEPPPPRL